VSASYVILANQALRLLGEASITSLGEGSELSETVSTLFEPTMRGLLASYPWRHTLRKARLARLETPPLTEWQHAHALPPDRLNLRALFNTDAPGAEPVQDFELFETRVFSRHLDLWADYQVWVDPAAWPPHVADAARHVLAATFAVPVTGSTSLAEYWRRTAYGTPQEQGLGGAIAQARRLDAQQQPPQRIRDFPLDRARMGGGRRWR
jgi:hypothetical protein